MSSVDFFTHKSLVDLQLVDVMLIWVCGIFIIIFFYFKDGLLLKIRLTKMFSNQLNAPARDLYTWTPQYVFCIAFKHNFVQNEVRNKRMFCCYKGNNQWARWCYDAQLLLNWTDVLYDSHYKRKKKPSAHLLNRFGVRSAPILSNKHICIFIKSLQTQAKRTNKAPS